MGWNSLPPATFVNNAVDIVPAAVPAWELLDHVASNLACPAGCTRPRRPPLGNLVGLVGLVVRLCRRPRPLLGLRVRCRRRGGGGFPRVGRGLVRVRQVVSWAVSRRRCRLGAGVELGLAVRHCWWWWGFGRRVEAPLRVHRFAEVVAYSRVRNPYVHKGVPVVSGLGPLSSFLLLFLSQRVLTARAGGEQFDSCG